MDASTAKQDPAKQLLDVEANRPDFDEVDQASDESFPASDPPAFSSVDHVGPPTPMKTKLRLANKRAN